MIHRGVRGDRRDDNKLKQYHWKYSVELQCHMTATRNTSSCMQFEGEFASVFSALSAVNDSENFKMGTEIPECLIYENIQRAALVSRQSSFL